MAYKGEEASSCIHAHYRSNCTELSAFLQVNYIQFNVQMFQSYCERSIDSIIFYPAKNDTNGLKGIEIALKGAAKKSCVEECQLDDTTILDWLHKVCRHRRLHAVTAKS